MSKYLLNVISNIIKINKLLRNENEFNKNNFKTPKFK